MTELIAILILMAAGGGIAYLGDWIGLYMGKHRMSVFGLRPRSTARVFTVAAGAAIALMSYGVLVSLDSGFRIALREGAQIIHRNRELGRQNKQLQLQIAGAMAAFKAAQAEVASARTDRDAAMADYRAASVRLAVANTAIAKAGAQLASVRAQLGVSTAALAAANKNLNQATARVAALQTQIATDEESVRRIGQEHFATSHGDLIYRERQEIGRTVIRSDQPVEAIRDQIRLFIQQLSADALSQGASRGDDGHAVQIASVRIVSSGEGAGNSGKQTSQSGLLGEEDNIDALADQIHAYHSETGTIVLIAEAFVNSFAGHPTLITLHPYANHLIFSQGQVLARIAVPASDRDPDRILTAITNLIYSAKTAAIQAGAIPVTENPRANESNLISVPIGEMVDIVLKVMAIHGNASIAASAAQDVHSADPVRLNFAVTAAQPGQPGGSQ
jgi:hypothetical protein